MILTWRKSTSRGQVIPQSGLIHVIILLKFTKMQVVEVTGS